MIEIKIDIAQFYEEFLKEYKFLYENYDNVAGYREAVQAFDDFLTTNNGFINEFVKYRGDFISSDREAAAFMFAMEKYM